VAPVAVAQVENLVLHQPLVQLILVVVVVVRVQLQVLVLLVVLA
jgi:hypothetical protein